MTAIFVIPLSLAALRMSPFDLSRLPEQAALLSAMVNMPEGSIELLESRFRDRLDQEYRTQGEESEVEPYISDWPDEENPDLEPPPASSHPSPSVNEEEEPEPTVTDPSPAKDSPPEIPEEYRGTLLQENMAGTAKNLLQYGAGKLRNYTDEPDSEIVEIMEQGMNLTLERTDAPQVLIFHTHATESYEPYDSETYDTRNTWRDTDNHKNMVAVGNALEQVLSDAGIGVVHDTTQHDYPSYNGSYERSAETIKSYLEKYPTIKIALDVASSELYNEKTGMYHFPGESRLKGSEVVRDTAEMISYYEDLIEKFPVISIEDGLAEDDWDGWKELTRRLGGKIQLVGDDLFVTNTKRLDAGIKLQVANAILVKVNQIGTVSEAMEAIEMAHKNAYRAVISHRSGETEDTFIADLAVAVNAGQIKTGAPCRSDRVAKYNQLLRIEEELGEVGAYKEPFNKI